MKRLLLFPILIFGLSFACDQPYEEVGGIKIGCPLVDSDFKLSPQSDDDERVESFEKKLTDSFFSTARVQTLDGVVEKVDFEKVYFEFTDAGKDWDSMLSNLSKRWGEHKGFEVEGIKSYSIDNPNSSLLSNVIISQMYTRSTAVSGVTYISKKIKDYTESLRAEEEAQRSRQLEDF